MTIKFGGYFHPFPIWNGSTLLAKTEQELHRRIEIVMWYQWWEAGLLAGGLASQGRRGLIDKFRGRLIFPIADLTGDVIGFGARKLAADDDGPKYLNSPETVLFKKSSVLYGADLAKRDIAKQRQAVLVEGYTDVMACHLAGVTTAVATSGTSFGEGHVTILRRLLMDASEFRGEVIFTFDGDAAGQRAALRAFAMEDKFVTQTFVTVQPDGIVTVWASVSVCAPP